MELIIFVIWLIILIVILIFISKFLLRVLANYCDIRNRAEYMDTRPEEISKIEKKRMLVYPLFIAGGFVVLSFLLFYYTTYSIFESIEINSYLLGIIGFVFATIPSLSIKIPTAYNRLHRRGTWGEKLFQDKRIFLHIILGIYFILSVFVIRIPTIFL